MNLQLSLKKNWFEMTKSGEKTEDYRDITPYWIKRLLLYENKNININNGWRNNQIEDIVNDLIETEGNNEQLNYQIDNWYLSFKPYKTNTMTLGYPKKTDTERILKLEHKGIEIRTGNTEWGAEPNKLYFVIKHGTFLNEV